MADSDAALAALMALAEGQRGHGVRAGGVHPKDFEPQLADGMAGAVFYPQDAQVQPMLAAAHLLRGAEVRTGVTVTGLLRHGERVVGVRTSDGEITAGAVVNAAGTAAGEIAALAGTVLPIAPRRGFVLVTEALPPLIRHKVYTAAYVTDVASDDAALATSAVVEGTPAGNVLIGASRERVGFDRTMSPPVLSVLAAQAIALFPALREVRAIRAYCGFRPYCPDHLPVIGADPAVPGLLHAGGHEGAGIGLAPATGEIIAALLTGAAPPLDIAPFAPGRFA